VVGVASLALAEPGSIFTYNYTKDYYDNSDIPKKSGSCLMARGAMENDLEHFFIPKNSDICLMARGDKVIDPPSLSNILDENDDVEEDDVITGLFKVKCFLRGDALAMFDFLMESVASRD
jgi:hypothetical protein